MKGKARQVQRQYKDDVDINNIVQKSLRGLQPTINGKIPMYGDISGIPTFKEMMDITSKANQNFMKLPAEVRGRFHNNTTELVEFISDEKNYDEAVEMGFISEESIENKKEKAQEAKEAEEAKLEKENSLSSEKGTESQLKKD